MGRNRLAHFATFAMALAVIFCGSTIYYAAREHTYETYTQSQHQKSLSNLLSSLTNMETALEKVRYAPSGAMRQTLAAEVWKESQLASSALSDLPLSGASLEETETYVSQAGDYAYYLLRSSAYGRSDEAEWSTLCSLSDNAASMVDSLGVLKEQLDAGAVSFRQISAEASDLSDGVTTAMSNINDEFPEYASLIYDGPYSDHVANRKALALENQGEVTQQQAAEAAAKFLDAEPAALSFSYASEGQIPCYCFAQDDISISVSKQGGMVLTMTDNRQPATAAYTPEEAVQKARDYLSTHGYPSMQTSYYTVYEAVVTINFAYAENGIIAYPDLVKVGVSLDDGSIVRFDAVGYAMNHHARTPAEPQISVAQARRMVPDTLSVTAQHRSIIPTTGFHEVDCWEFVCTTKENGHAIVFVNCENGQQENILLLIESETGVLTR